MGDLASAKRALMWLKEAVSSARWDNYESQLPKVEQALEGIPDAEKAEVVAEVAALRLEAEKAMKDEKAKRLLREIDRRLDFDASTLVASSVVEKLEDVLTRLSRDEVTSVVEPGVLATYRAKIDARLGPARTAANPGRPPEKAAAAPAPAPVAAASAPKEENAKQPDPPRAAEKAVAQPAAAPSVDLGPAKRELSWVKDTISSRDWDRYERQVEKVERALENIPAADKAALVAELAQLREEADAGRKREKASRLLDEIERGIRGADPDRNAADTVKSMLATVSQRLDSDEVKSFLEPEVITQLRAKIASVGGASAAAEKSRYMEKITSLVKEYETTFGSGPFAGLDGDAARRIHQSLSSNITGVRNNLTSLPKGDPDTTRMTEKLAEMEKKLETGWADWDQARETQQLAESWTRTQERFSGWKAETAGPTWEAFCGYADNVTSLLMPQTLRAIDQSSYFLEEAEPTKKRFPDDAAVTAIVGDATQVRETATAKVLEAFEKLMAEAEKASLPTDKRECEKTQKIVSNVSGWFNKTAHMSSSEARARALHAVWTRSVEALDEQGAALYGKLEAEAAAKWPAILGTIKIDADFDPTRLEQWTGKTILIAGTWNRAGWDFDGSHHFEVRLGETPVAGDWDERINAALGDAVTRTRRSVDDHKDWDVVAVVLGPGKVKTRTQRELLVKGTNEKIKTESWEPEPCVLLKIIALRAGPVAIGP